MGSYEQAVGNRLKTARGHLDGVIRMVESEAYCPDVMKQLAAVQGLLEGTSREVLRHHLEGCVAKAMQEGRVEEIVDELMTTLKYDKRVLAPRPVDTAGPDATGSDATGSDATGSDEHGAAADGRTGQATGATT